MEISHFLESTREDMEGCYIYYRGLTCFSFTNDTKGPVEQPLCSRMNNFPYEEIFSTVIPAERAEHIIFRVKEIPLAMRRILPISSAAWNKIEANYKTRFGFHDEKSSTTL